MKSTSRSGCILLPFALFAAACGGDDEADPTRPLVVRFEASEARVDPGERFLLQWAVEGADSITITTLDGNLIVGGSEEAEGRAMAGPLLADTTFALRAEGPGGRTGASVLVQVDYPIPEITRFVVEPNVVLAGDPAFLFWETNNGATVDITDSGGGLLIQSPDASGSLSIQPTEDEVYTLTLTGPGGVETATAGVSVRLPPPNIVAFGAEPTRVFRGDATLLSWHVQNATSVQVVADGAQIVSTSSIAGTFSVVPTGNTTYELIAMGDGQDSATVDVEVFELEAPKIVDLVASPTVVGIGDSTTLSWSMSGVERYRIFANGAVVAEQETTGELANEPVTVTSTRTVFRVEVENRIDTASASIEVIGHRAPAIDTFSVTPTVLSTRGMVTVRWSARDVSALDLLRDGAPLDGFTPVRATGPAVDAQGNLTVEVRDLARFTLLASSDGGALSADELVVVGVTEVEPNDRTNIAMVLTGTSGRVRGELSGPSDVDVYEIEMPDDGRVVARTLTGAGICDLDTVVTLLAPDGSSVILSDDNDGVGPCGLLDAEVDPEVSGLTSGTYFLTVEAGTSTSAGVYALEFEARKPTCGDGRREGVEQCDDGNQTNGDGCDSSCNVEVAGVIAGPSGRIAITHPGGAGSVIVAVDVAAAGQTILARANDPNAGGCTNVDTRLQLLDPSFTLLGDRADGGVSGTAGTCAAFSVPPDTFAADLAVGRHYLRVLADSAAGGAVEVIATLRNPACGNGVLESRASEQCDDGNLVSGDGCSATCRIEASQFPEVEPNDTQATAFPTGLTGAGTATIQGANNPGGDDDVFSLSVPANQTLRLSARTYTMSGAPTSCDSQRTDTRLYLELAGVEAMVPNSGELAFNDDIDNANNIWCSEISGFALSGGATGQTFYLRVQGWRDMQTTDYFLSVQLAP